MYSTQSAHSIREPVFILAAPRSGSTLLFETLMQAEELWTIGDESHAIFESIPELRPGHGVTSNRLIAGNATPEVITRLHTNFLQQLKNRTGVSYLHQEARPGSVRMLEKTPKNSLRVPFLDVAFPDSRFIYLYRDPRENISSIIEAWRSGQFVTYPDLLGAGKHWSLLLPPDWQSVAQEPLETIAAYQWKTANQYILDDLGKLDAGRWAPTSYHILLAQPFEEIQRLCNFMGIQMDEHLEKFTKGRLPLSRYTLTTPSRGKWRKNKRELERVLPALKKFISYAESVVDEKSGMSNNSGEVIQPRIGRNSLCPCGSGKKYKKCHGQVAT
jgi:hypothetical protein